MLPYLLVVIEMDGIQKTVFGFLVYPFAYLGRVSLSSGSGHEPRRFLASGCLCPRHLLSQIHQSPYSRGPHSLGLLFPVFSGLPNLPLAPCLGGGTPFFNFPETGRELGPPVRHDRLW